MSVKFSVKGFATAFAVLTVIAGFWFGGGFLLDGEGAADGFGIDPWPTGNATGYFAVKGARDIAYALVVLALLLLRQRTALGWVLLADAVIPIGDAYAVLSSDGDLALALSVHGSAVVMLLIGSGLFFLEGRQGRQGRKAALAPEPELTPVGV